MPGRRDGKETRRSILEAASRLFCEHGHCGTTHSMICEQAGVNIAAINYHFRSKDRLYRAVFEHVRDETDRRCPMDGGVPAAAPAEERLRGFITAAVQRALDPELHRLHRLRMLEAVNPTGLLDEAFARIFRAHQSHLLGVLSELLGSAAARRELELAEVSIVSQWLFLHPPPNSPRRRHPWRFAPEDAPDIAAHITDFSLAGIAAMRRRLDTGTADGVTP